MYPRCNYLYCFIHRRSPLICYRMITIISPKRSCQFILLMSVIAGFPFKSISPNPHKHKYSKRPPTKVNGASAGRSDRIRTCGLNIPNVARYQLRHTPTAFLLYMINTGVSTDSGGKILRKRKFILKKDLQNTRGCGNISRYDCQMGIYTLICVEAGGCGP